MIALTDASCDLFHYRDDGDAFGWGWAVIVGGGPDAEAFEVVLTDLGAFLALCQFGVVNTGLTDETTEESLHRKSRCVVLMGACSVCSGPDTCLLCRSIEPLPRGLYTRGNGPSKSGFL
jgi:hypothetical protein